MARESDIESMQSLLAELFALEADFQFNPEKQRQGLQCLLAHELADVLVAECDGRVVGMCSMQRVVSTAEGGWAGLVEDVVVAEAYRGQGIGAQMLLTMERRARAWGIQRLQLLADARNQQALSFYAGQGWLDTQLVVRRKLIGKM